ncbi:cysteine proteinase [Gyrodon lividus]|nr:cysteine proteinase [Gyrodon lividus]
MAIGKWISFTQQVPSTTDTPLTQGLPISCADGKQFGLENFGNTCYANSVLQALYFCSPFRELVIQHTDPYASLQQALASHFTPTTTPASAATRRKPERKSTQDLPTSNGVPHPPTPPVPSAPRTLFSALRSLYIHISQNPADKGTVAPRAFVEKLRELNEAFRNTMHQDAHEFLNYLLNRIVEEIEEGKKHRMASGDDLPQSVKSSSSASHPPGMTASNSSSSSPSPGMTFIHQIFEGILTSETRCLTCENVSSRDESFLDLSIDIEQNSSVTACLRQFSASEMLCQREKFFCDACCDLQEAERRMKIKHLPNVLALHLKRFKYQEDVQKYIKLTYRVAFPFELRLFNTVDDIHNPDRLYELFAIVVHIGGGPNHGHYVSIIKTMGTWLVFDDETVDSIKEGDISKYFGESNSGSAYVLYYQAVDIDLAALGLRPPSPTPLEQTLPNSETSHQGPPTDSPVSTSQEILPVPPGLANELTDSTEVPETLPPSITSPIPTEQPPVPSGKSPRKTPSQLLKIGLGSSPTRAATIGSGASPTTRNGFLRPLRPVANAVDEKHNSVSKPTLPPMAIFPKQDIDPSEHHPPGAISAKEKEPEKKMTGWFRRRSLKGGGKARPTSEASRDRPPLPADLLVGTVPPGWVQTMSSSSQSSKDSRRPSESATTDYVAPFPSPQSTSSSGTHILSQETGPFKALSPPVSVSSSYTSSSTTSIPPSLLQRSQLRPLPTIPASPQNSKIVQSPPLAFSRASSDHGVRAQRRHAMPSTKDFESSPFPFPKPLSRPATSTGTPTGKSLPPLPDTANGVPLNELQPSGAMTVPRPDKGRAKSDTQVDNSAGRPKSVHVSSGLGMSSFSASIASANTANSNTKRAKRKLSLTAPMLGFGKKDKDKRKEKDNERER